MTKERINISVEPELLERIGQAAEAEHTTRSALVRRVMREYVDAERAAAAKSEVVAEARAAYAPALAAAPGLDATLPLLRAFFAGRHDVEAAWVFGSLATGRAGALSDVDVAVLPTVEAADSFDRLEISSRLADALGGRRVDVAQLGSGSTLLSYRVACEGVLIMGGGLPAAEACLRAVSEHLDFQGVARKADSYFAERVSGYDALR